MSIQEAFDKFYKNIKLTSKQRKDAKRKYHGVCKKLHDHYYPGIKYDGSTKLLIGSYGKHTNIRPPRDVDVIFILPNDLYKSYSDNSTNPQSQLLQDIRIILSEKYSTTEKIKAWGKVVYVKFSDGAHSIEVLPAWQQEDGTFKIPNSEKGGSWEEWNVRSELENISEFETDNGITRKLIRIVKKWTDNCTIQIKSYEIEAKVLEYLFSGIHKDKSLSLTIKDFFDFFQKNEADGKTKSHLVTAYNRSLKACDFEDDNEYEKASIEWQKIFGTDFPHIYTTKQTSELSCKIFGLQANYPSQKEQYLDKDFGIRFNLDPRYLVKIGAQVLQDGFRRDWLSRLPVLRKRKKLTFEVVRNTVPPPYRIMWKVRNFGDEANSSNDLRGEISVDNGRANKEENTKYQGDHYVECYVIQNDECVALDKIIVPIGSAF